MRGYYYCSLSTFLNIVKHRQIYLSDPLKMNDSLEIQWYLDKLDEQERSVKPSRSILNMLNYYSTIEFTYDDLIRALNIYGQCNAYICCFSKKSDILSQWRAYAGDGQGLSIGFNLEKLNKEYNLMVCEVLYNDDITYGRLEDQLENFAREMSEVIKCKKITDEEEKIKILLHEFIPLLLQCKNPAFEEEQEVRLIYCDDMKFEAMVDDAIGRKPILLEHDFRITGNNNITEFVKLDFDPDAIEHICIGPKCSMSINDVKRMVKTLLGSDIEVSKSKSSYR